MDQEQELWFAFDLEYRSVKQIYQSLCFHLEKWPGNNDDPYEQERLRDLKYNFYKLMIEKQYIYCDSE